MHRMTSSVVTHDLTWSLEMAAFMRTLMGSTDMSQAQESSGRHHPLRNYAGADGRVAVPKS